jgi:Zn-finger protein
MSYKFFQNKECEYFPCHKTDKVDDFNCLFCFCPLYNQHENCGGGFKILPSGIKDCRGCRISEKATMKLFQNCPSDSFPILLFEAIGIDRKKDLF